MWFQIFKFYNEDPEVHLDLKSEHVLQPCVLHGVGHIGTRNLENKAIKYLS